MDRPNVVAVITQRFRHQPQEQAVDLAGELNLILGFRACDPHPLDGTVVIRERGVRELVRLVDSLEANVIIMHGMLAPPPSASVSTLCL